MNFRQRVLCVKQFPREGIPIFQVGKYYSMWEEPLKATVISRKGRKYYFAAIPQKGMPYFWEHFSTKEESK